MDLNERINEINKKKELIFATIKKLETDFRNTVNSFNKAINDKKIELVSLNSKLELLELLEEEIN